jgi:hypothetical protein
MLWSVGDTSGAELSEHPNSTNAKLAISNRTSDSVFIALPFLMICELVKVLRVGFSLRDETAGSSGTTKSGTLGGSTEPTWISSTPTYNVKLSCVHKYALGLAARGSSKRALQPKNRNGVQSSGPWRHWRHEVSWRPPARRVFTNGEDRDSRPEGPEQAGLQHHGLDGRRSHRACLWPNITTEF